jgi:hypothetical protein
MASENQRDSFSRAHRIVDVDRIVEAHADFDWEYLFQQTRAGGLDSIVFLALELARELLGTPVPAEILDRLRPTRIVHTHLDLLLPANPLFRPDRSARPAATALLGLWLIVGGRRRARHFLRLLAGPKDPIEWVWQNRERPPQVLSAIYSGAKQAAGCFFYQIWLYVRRIAGR